MSERLGSETARWVDARTEELLPVPYFHTVFTLPDALNRLVLLNKRALYELLFQSVRETLLDLGRNNLGVTLGFFAHAPDQDGAQKGSLVEWIRVVQSLADLPQDGRKAVVVQIWQDLSRDELLVFNKLLTGGLRIGVSKGLLALALARVCGLQYEVIWQRLAGEWKPEDLSLEFFKNADRDPDSIVPYPFFLAYPLDRDIKDCGERAEWQIEWKWDGIRAQVIKRGKVQAIWSRGDELISESFPELFEAAVGLPEGTVLDGEVVAWGDGRPGTFLICKSESIAAGLLPH